MQWFRHSRFKPQLRRICEIFFSQWGDQPMNAGLLGRPLRSLPDLPWRPVENFRGIESVALRTIRVEDLNIWCQLRKKQKQKKNNVILTWKSDIWQFSSPFCSINYLTCSTSMKLKRRKIKSFNNQITTDVSISINDLEYVSTDQLNYNFKKYVEKLNMTFKRIPIDPTFLVKNSRKILSCQSIASPCWLLVSKIKFKI